MEPTAEKDAESLGGDRGGRTYNVPTPTADYDAAWERGYRDAITDLQADYPYGDMPEWRAVGVEWLTDRLAERRVLPPVRSDDA